MFHFSGKGKEVDVKYLINNHVLVTWRARFIRDRINQMNKEVLWEKALANKEYLVLSGR